MLLLVPCRSIERIEAGRARRVSLGACPNAELRQEAGWRGVRRRTSPNDVSIACLLVGCCGWCERWKGWRLSELAQPAFGDVRVMGAWPLVSLTTTRIYSVEYSHSMHEGALWVLSMLALRTPCNAMHSRLSCLSYEHEIHPRRVCIPTRPYSLQRLALCHYSDGCSSEVVRESGRCTRWLHWGFGARLSPKAGCQMASDDGQAGAAADLPLFLPH